MLNVIRLVVLMPIVWADDVRLWLVGNLGLARWSERYGWWQR